MKSYFDWSQRSTEQRRRNFIANFMGRLWISFLLHCGNAASVPYLQTGRSKVTGSFPLLSPNCKSIKVNVIYSIFYWSIEEVRWCQLQHHLAGFFFGILFPREILGSRSKIALKVHWNRTGMALRLLWNFWKTWWKIALKVHRNCSEIAPELLWNCTGTALELL